MAGIHALQGVISVQHKASGRTLDMGLTGKYDTADKALRLMLRAKSSPQAGKVVTTTHATMNPISGKEVEGLHIYREKDTATRIAAAVAVQFQAIETGIDKGALKTLTPMVSAGGAVNLTTGAAALGARIQVSLDEDGLTGSLEYQARPGSAARLQGPELQLNRKDLETYKQFFMDRV